MVLDGPFAFKATACATIGEMIRLGVATTLALVFLNLSSTFPQGETAPTTELSCNFGMAKDQKTGTCTIPVPRDCKVANFPGSTKPWSSVSKGGRTNCSFDDRATDWKTRVTGRCDRCKTPQCSARFSVMVQCQ